MKDKDSYTPKEVAAIAEAHAALMGGREYIKRVPTGSTLNFDDYRGQTLAFADQIPGNVDEHLAHKSNDLSNEISSTLEVLKKH